MVFPNQLVETVAGTLGLPHQTVALHDRILAANGHRKTGGRGRSAAKVSALDAASLIIAVIAAPIAGPHVRDTAKNFERYAALSAQDFSSAVTWPADLKVLQELGVGHTFRDALTTLIESYSRGKLEQTADVSKHVDREPFSVTGGVEMFISVTGPRLEAKISILGQAIDPVLAGAGAHPADYLKDTYKAELAYRETIPPMSLHDLRQWAAARLPAGDLTQVRTVTESTIAAVAELFRGSSS